MNRDWFYIRCGESLCSCVCVCVSDCWICESESMPRCSLRGVAFAHTHRRLSSPCRVLAAVARHIYVRPGVGVGALTKVYGGAHDRGTST